MVHEHFSSSQKWENPQKTQNTNKYMVSLHKKDLKDSQAGGSLG